MFTTWACIVKCESRTTPRFLADLANGTVASLTTRVSGNGPADLAKAYN